MFRVTINTIYPNACGVCITADSGGTERKPKQLMAEFVARPSELHSCLFLFCVYY